MTDKTTHNKKHHHEKADNVAQNEIKEETVSTEQMAQAEQPINNENEESVTGGGDTDKIKKLQSEVDELKDKNLRLVAEFDNFRRRNAKERIELVQTAGKDIIQSLLVVLDDVDRANKQLENTQDVTVIKEGISLVFNKLRATLQQKGLKLMDANGQEFNPDLHEAITEIPVPNEEMKGKIIDVVEQGYYLNDKLIRHAKVVVGK